MDIGGLSYRDAQAVALDGDFPARDGMTRGENPEFITLLGVERNHRAAPHAEELLHGHRAAAEDNGEFDIDMMDLAFTGHATTPFDSLVEPERVAGV